MTDIQELVSVLPPVFVWHLSGWNTSPKRSTIPPPPPPPKTSSVSAVGRRGGQGRRPRSDSTPTFARIAEARPELPVRDAEVVQRLTTEVQHPEQKYRSIHCPANQMWSSQMASSCTFTRFFFFSFDPGNDLTIHKKKKKSLALSGFRSSRSKIST